ncbi:hypothetical protein BTRA_5330 [Burkholderia thailandensis USAMRU Malaysia |uniref:hypothetical protein n=1 Tax=Burkholderia thailandensis TaxID=57975 RepID=UPI0003EC81A4|nr:hypothetical protein [Burkholderia thailandensis]AHI75972.1 hypothetical protein BTQ_3568 [Burkholderia thailandensis 2002721723]AIC89454.1 hypothetical protein BTRA_5330 [Burkholderia thailandensis USAMRU Malaysia \
MIGGIETGYAIDVAHIDGIPILSDGAPSRSRAIGEASPVIRAARARAASIDKAMQLRVLEQHDRLAVGDLA